MATTPMSDFDGTIIDADFHIYETFDNLYPYLEDPYDRWLEHKLDPDEYWGVYPKSGLYSVAEATTDIERETEKNRLRRQTTESPAKMYEAMELLDLDRVVITPTQNMGLGLLPYARTSSALASAYNRFLLDSYLDDGDELFGSLVVSPQQPRRAADEIDERGDENDICAVFLPPAGAHPPLGDERYHPIYRAAERRDLPIMLHNYPGGMIHWPFLYDGLNSYLSFHTLSHPLPHMVNLASIISRGVAERFPDLEFVVQESGIGWVPWFTYRMDQEYSINREAAPQLSKPPSEYLRTQIFFTSQPIEGHHDPTYLHTIINRIGTSQLLFASDFPHYDFDNTDALFDGLQLEFDSDTIADIYGNNAMEVFDFE